MIITEESIKLLSKAEAEVYSHCVGLAIYLGEERRDCRFSIKELARRMTDPRRCDMVNLRILGRYLKGTPRMARMTKFNQESSIEGARLPLKHSQIVILGEHQEWIDDLLIAP